MKNNFSFFFIFLFLLSSLDILCRLGQPGVDAHVRHEGESACAVVQIEFLVNMGTFVTVTADDTLHFWSYQKKNPVVVHSLKFQRER